MSQIKQTRSVVADNETGEVISDLIENTVISFPKEPSYVKMYIEDICSLNNVSNSDQALLRLLLIRLDYEGYVALTPRSREAIAKTLGISLKTLRNRLNKLVNSTLIKPTSKSEYMVNPNYFARGTWKHICEQRKSFAITISYSEGKNGVAKKSIETKATD